MTMQRIALALNPLLAIFGRKIVRTYIGRWRVEGEKVIRSAHPIGWRVARRSEPDVQTELDRILGRNVPWGMDG